ncbi:Ribosomal RNA small subunit methyltransferase D [subsurface metagenome]
MRITGGVHKGRKILVPRGVIRPAMDRMRESLFAILGDLNGSSFLDLYAGSGVVGIEAASRGAAPVVFVEKDYAKKQTLKRNCEFLTTGFQIYMMPVQRFIKRWKGSFDLIYLDPPFNLRGKFQILTEIEDNELLSEKGIMIIHAPGEEIFPKTLTRLSLTDLRQYGRSVLLFFKA